MVTLNPPLQKFVEQMGLIMERMGASRTFGRILGLVLVVEEPMSLKDMAEVLQVSKASVSTNTRMCEQTGLLKRVSKPGDRRTYYEMLPGAFETTIRRRIIGMHEMLEVVKDGMAGLDDAHPLARQRMQELYDLYLYLGEGMDAALTQWNAMKNQQSTA